MADSEIRKGLYPTPPNLSAKTEVPFTSRNAARDFWIIKNGIKHGNRCDKAKHIHI